jgi:hypothetical protein
LSLTLRQTSPTPSADRVKHDDRVTATTCRGDTDPDDDEVKRSVDADDDATAARRRMTRGTRTRRRDGGDDNANDESRRDVLIASRHVGVTITMHGSLSVHSTSRVQRRRSPPTDCGLSN